MIRKATPTKSGHVAWALGKAEVSLLGAISWA